MDCAVVGPDWVGMMTLIVLAFLAGGALVGAVLFPEMRRPWTS